MRSQNINFVTKTCQKTYADMSYLLSTLPRHHYSFTAVQPSLTPGHDVLGKRPVAVLAAAAAGTDLAAVGTLLAAAAAGTDLVAVGTLLAGTLLAGTLLVAVGMLLVGPFAGLAASARAS